MSATPPVSGGRKSGLKTQKSAMSFYDFMSARGGLGWAAFIAIQYALQPTLFRMFVEKGTPPSSLVVGSEVFKMLMIILLLSMNGTGRQAWREWSLIDSLRTAGLPSATFVIQNYCIAVAYQSLDGVMFNVLNQAKIPFTALFAFLIVGKASEDPDLLAIGRPPPASLRLRSLHPRARSQAIVLLWWFALAKEQKAADHAELPIAEAIARLRTGPDESKKQQEKQKQPPRAADIEVRHYVHQVLSDELDEKVKAMLGELHRFQERAKEKDPLRYEKNKRYCVGMREAKRAVVRRRAKGLVVAPNLEAPGGAGALRTDGLTYTQVAAGGDHTVLLRSAGTAAACGRNNSGHCDLLALALGPDLQSALAASVALQASLDSGSMVVVTFGGADRCRIRAAPTARLADIYLQLVAEHRAGRLGPGAWCVEAILPGGRPLSSAAAQAARSAARAPVAALLWSGMGVAAACAHRLPDPAEDLIEAPPARGPAMLGRAAATENEVPVIFALSRNRMGKALGKNVRLSIVCVVNTEGVHPEFKQVLKLVDDLRRQWVIRQMSRLTAEDAEEMRKRAEEKAARDVARREEKRRLEAGDAPPKEERQRIAAKEAKAAEKARKEAERKAEVERRRAEKAARASDPAFLAEKARQEAERRAEEERRLAEEKAREAAERKAERAKRAAALKAEEERRRKEEEAKAAEQAKKEAERAARLAAGEDLESESSGSDVDLPAGFCDDLF
ncbi:unnamed protein product [Prorocentrum cordatum]|uniref:Uncharacterized protein n=1 Tax=Prorocentrum cordatum TaxID=2364126 RepID=A0ABN9V9J3_9DINO|nr:unnamed protein product [Polarella glacialis]